MASIRNCILAGFVLVVAANAATIATYPPGTTLENIVIAPSGELYVTAINSGTVYRVDPSGASQVFGQAPGTTLGISRDLDGAIVAAGGSAFYRFESNGTPAVVTRIPGAQMLNGITLFSASTFLVADSLAATVWKVNLATGAAQAWSTDSLLGIPPGSTRMVGANGVKLFGGAVYVSNTSSSSVLRIPILPDGSAGPAEVYASNLQLDDFAFASDGTLFGATQFGNSVVRLGPDGMLSTIATSSDGLLGDAALAFGRTASDNQDIYVVNNGGAFANLPGGPQAASIVRLNAGVTGAIPELQAVPEPAALFPVGGLLLTGILLLLRPRSAQPSSSFDTMEGGRRSKNYAL